MIGQIISHYKILRKLGEGGMGVVYKAEDTKLKRIVALKFLPKGLETPEPERARFLQEAQAASALNHPNVCTIYDIKEECEPATRMAGKHHFIVMEYVDGETLRTAIVNGHLSFENCLSYAVQIGEALQEAHNHGIVHRDIKPENIMVNKRNQVKVMDFGLAKLKGSLKLTKTSSTVGTLAYMAPEQIQGGEIDARSDIFSFGIVLYEMLTGRLPFRGEHEAAIMYSILNEEPQDILKFRSDIPRYFISIINKSLQKDVNYRYQDMGELLNDLRNYQSGRSKREFSPMRRQPSIAVMPFRNLSADPEQEYFCDGLAEEIINVLSRLDNLRVVARSSAFTFKGNKEDIREIGRKLNVETLLDGSVRKSGNHLRIMAELIDVADGSHLWSDKFDRNLEDIFAIQDEISLAIVNNLKVKLLKGEETKLVKHRADNPDAYNLYMKGRFFFNQRKEEGIKKSIDCYLHAIKIDPEFALAYTGLAESYIFLGDWRILPLDRAYNEARKAAMTAVRIDDTLSEVHLSLGDINLFCDWNWKAAEQEYKHALSINPASAEAHHMYAHYFELKGQFDEALIEINRAIELEPVSPAIQSCNVQILFYSRRYKESAKECYNAMEMAPNYFGLYGWLGIAYVKDGNVNRGIEALHEGLSHLPDDPRLNAFLGYTYAIKYQRSDAEKCLAKLFTLSKERFVDPYFISLIYAGQGNKSIAADWLNKAYKEHSEWLPWLGVDPLLDDLRNYEGFMELKRKMNL